LLCQSIEEMNGIIVDPLKPEDSLKAHRYGGLDYNCMKKLEVAFEDEDLPKGEVGNLNPPGLNAQVLGILRYIPEEASMKNILGFGLWGRGYHEVDMYDIILSDGSFRMRAILHPKFNPLVRSGRLNLLSHIRMESWKQIIHEDIRLPVLVKFEVVSHRNSIITNLNTSSNSSGSKGIAFSPVIAVSNLEKWEEVKKSNRITFWRSPLLPGRHFYLPLSTDDCIAEAMSCPGPYTPIVGYISQQFSDMFDEITLDKIERNRLTMRESKDVDLFLDNEWKKSMGSEDDEILKEQIQKWLETPLSIPELFQLSKEKAEKSGKHFEQKDSKDKGFSLEKPIVGLVIGRSALLHFAKPGKSGGLPLRFYFDIADKTGHYRVTCWHRVCLSAFTQVRVGNYVLLRNVRAKRLGGKAAPKAGEEATFEFAIDHIEKQGVYDISGGDEVTARLLGNELIAGARNPDNESELRAVDAQLFAQWHLHSSPSEKPRILICGVVKFVGRRQLLKAYNNSLYEFRWITVHDPDTAQDMTLQMYANSDAGNFERITPGSWILCTKIVVYGQMISSTMPLSVIFRSSSMTSYFVLPTLLENVAVPIMKRLQRAFPEVSGKLVAWMKKHGPRLVKSRRIYNPDMPPISSIASTGRQKRARRLASSSSSKGHEQPNHERDFLCKSNASQHLDIESKGCSFVFSPSMMALTARFVPLEEVKVEDLIDEARLEDMMVAESLHYRVKVRLTGIKMEQAKESKRWTAELTLVDPDNEQEAVTAYMYELPWIGPSISPRDAQDKAFMEGHFSFRLFGKTCSFLELEKLERNRTQLEIWLEVHKKSFCIFETHVFGAHADFHPNKLAQVQNT